MSMLVIAYAKYTSLGNYPKFLQFPFSCRAGVNQV